MIFGSFHREKVLQRLGLKVVKGDIGKKLLNSDW